MSYWFDMVTGEKYNEHQIGLCRTFKGWCPFYNLEGKYVGCCTGTGTPQYYNPAINEDVYEYKDMDW